MRILLGHLSGKEAADFAATCAQYSPLLANDSNPMTYASVALGGEVATRQGREWCKTPFRRVLVPS
jgi:hypothetical protein